MTHIATIIITALLVSNPFGWIRHATEPTELTVYSSDLNLDKVFIDVPYVDILSYMSGGNKGVDNYQSRIAGIDIGEVIELLENQYGVCVETTSPSNPSNYNEVDVTFVRANGVTDAPGKVRATYYLPADPWSGWPEESYLGMITNVGPKWSGFANTVGINPFTIELKVVEC